MKQESNDLDLRSGRSPYSKISANPGSNLGEMMNFKIYVL